MEEIVQAFVEQGVLVQGMHVGAGLAAQAQQAAPLQISTFLPPSKRFLPHVLIGCLSKKKTCCKPSP